MTDAANVDGSQLPPVTMSGSVTIPVAQLIREFTQEPKGQRPAED